MYGGGGGQVSGGTFEWSGNQMTEGCAAEEVGAAATTHVNANIARRTLIPLVGETELLLFVYGLAG